MSTKIDTRQNLNDLSTTDLVVLHNECLDELNDTTTKRVKKFATKPAARTQVRKLFNELRKARGEIPEKAPRVKKVRAEGEKADRRRTEFVPTGEPLIPCLAGSRQAAFLDTLARKGGATMDEILKVLSEGGWASTPTRVRASFGSSLRQKGYGVRSEGDRFFLVVPEGKSIPAHRERKTVAE